MAGIMNKFLDFMKLGGDEDDYDEDYYEDEEETAEERSTARARRQRTSAERGSRRAAAEEEPRVSGVSHDTARRERTNVRQERNGSKLVALQSAQKRSMEVRIQKPTSFDDSEELADMIIRGQAVVVNFEGLSHDDAQRIMDFLLGCIYAMDGKLNQISKYIFLFSPDGVDVSGGDVSLDNSGIPVFNSQF